jgi:hypothetical protein
MTVKSRSPAVRVWHDCALAAIATRQHAGVGHQDTERLERVDGAAFQGDHPVLLFQFCGGAEIGAARVGDGGDADAAVRGRHRGEAFQEGHAGFAEGFGIRHDVGLPDRDEIPRAEIGSDTDLVLDGHWRAAPISPRRMASASSPSCMGILRFGSGSGTGGRRPSTPAGRSSREIDRLAETSPKGAARTRQF